MRNAGLRLAACFGLGLALLLAGCYQNASQPEQPGADLPSVVATFTPDAAAPPVTAAAAIDPGPPPDPQPAVEVDEPLDIDPLNLTATAIIARATRTQAALSGTVLPVEEIPVVTAAVPGASPTPPPDTSGEDCIHVVQAGDRGLSTIAALYGVTVADIQRTNNLANVEVIHVGNELTIPGCGTTGFRQSAAPGESCVPAEWRAVHTVQAGENLFRIALNYDMDANALALVNCIPDPALIRVGQQIYIP